MTELPGPIRVALQRLSRRLAIGLFLEVWPAWAVASLLAAGLVAIVCRLFVPGAASRLPWLTLLPVLAAVPSVIICYLRAFRPAEVVAMADWLGGGEGLLLTLTEREDPRWIESSEFERASRFPLPRLRPWRALSRLPFAVAFLAVTLWLPQRTPPRAANTVLADDMAAKLQASLVEVKQQALITPVEEQKLEEEIERIRRGAQERVDASSWEAADALRDRLVSGLAEKQDAVKWAEASLARYAAAAEGGADAESKSGAEAAELTDALEKLAKSGLLAGAPADLQRLLKGGKLPADPKAIRELTASLSKYLSETSGRFSSLARLGKEFGRFDPAEFPLEAGESAPDGDGKPGQGGINRGRGDAALTWGKESMPFDRFKATPLPPGAARSADDWSPLVESFGAPRESPELSAASTGRQYAAAAGQTAWRRTLAPRHQSAVKKYFAK